MKGLLYTAFLLVLVSGSDLHADRLPEDDESMIDDPRIQHRQYVFTPTGETLPFALFLPEGFTADSPPAPLIVALHGQGRTYDWMMGYDGFLDYAQQHGFVVAAPLGYTRRAWYGSRPTPDADDGLYSEEDVMEVLAEVREELPIDGDRIYLYGHSMGGAGTYHIASKNPYLFAGLAVAAPYPREDLAPLEQLNNIQHLPIMVLQGTADALVPVEMTRRWVDTMKSLGMQHIYIEIEGADHSLFISQNRDNMRKVVNFFDVVRKRYPPVVAPGT